MTHGGGGGPLTVLAYCDGWHVNFIVFIPRFVLAPSPWAAILFTFLLNEFVFLQRSCGLMRTKDGRQRGGQRRRRYNAQALGGAGSGEPPQ